MIEENTEQNEITNIDFIKITLDIYIKSFKESGVENKLYDKIWKIIFFPFALIETVMLLPYEFIRFIIRLINNPAKYLLESIKNDAPSPAAQSITFIIGYPLVFLSRLVTASLSVLLILMHIIINISAYIFSFGGVQWHPFIFDKGYVF